MSRRLFGSLVAAIAALSLFTWCAPAVASLPITQQGSIVGQEPVSGAYQPAYRNYAGQYCLNFHCYGGGYYRYVAGKFTTRLAAYRVKDGLRRYDFYFLTIETSISHSGDSDSGDVKMWVADTDAANQVDYADSPSMRAQASSCQTIDFSLGYSFGPISAGTDLGSASFCDASAHDVLSHRGTTAIYAISPIAKVNSLDTTRLEKVKAGTHPVFKIRIALPTDVCTSYVRLNFKPVCVAYRDGTTSHTYWVHTNGS